MKKKERRTTKAKNRPLPPRGGAEVWGAFGNLTPEQLEQGRALLGIQAGTPMTDLGGEVGK